MSSLTKSHHPMRNSYNPVRRPVPVAEPVRKRSSGQMRKPLLALMGISLVVMTLIGLSFGLLQAYRGITSSEYFAISDILVDGTRQLKAEDIVTASGLEPGLNSLSIHIPDLEKRILANPWVERVTIRRELPGHFIIHIEERAPQFWVLRNGTLHYLDATGSVIAPVENVGFKSLPTLDIGPGGEDAVVLLPLFMEKLQSARFPYDPAQLSWLRISAGKGFELYWEGKKLSISIGIEDWRENLQRVGLVIQDLENRNEISRVRDIRSADSQVWLQKI